MSFELIPRVLALNGIRPTEKLVLLVVANYCDERGKGCWASHATIGKCAGISARHALRVINQLDRRGLIRRLGWDRQHKTRKLGVVLSALPPTQRSVKRRSGQTQVSPHHRRGSPFTTDTGVVQTYNKPTEKQQIKVDRFSSIAGGSPDSYAGPQRSGETDEEFRRRLADLMGN
jgi:hypothetical protein